MTFVFCKIVVLYFDFFTCVKKEKEELWWQWKFWK